MRGKVEVGDIVFLEKRFDEVEEGQDMSVPPYHVVKIWEDSKGNVYDLECDEEKGIKRSVYKGEIEGVYKKGKKKGWGMKGWIKIRG